MIITSKLDQALRSEARSLKTVEEVQLLHSGMEARIRRCKDILKGKGKEEWFPFLHEMVDGMIKKSIEAESISCGGCREAYCCRLHIVTCLSEARLIKGYVESREGRLQIDRDLMNRQYEFERLYDGNYNRLVWEWEELLPEVDRSCVFLKDNRCEIYPVRPLSCRLHWSAGAVEDCAVLGGKYIAHLVVPGEEMMSAVMQMNKIVGLVSALREVGF